jgi:hypothetical protein
MAKGRFFKKKQFDKIPFKESFIIQLGMIRLIITMKKFFLWSIKMTKPVPGLSY